MKRLCMLVVLLSTPAIADDSNLDRKNLLDHIGKTHGLSAEQKSALAEVFAGSRYIGQGNPKVTKHPMTRTQCRDERKKAGLVDQNPAWEKICGGPFMAPLYAPGSQKPGDAKACIDQYEFPGIPCEYPVVWVRTSEAAAICHAMGKRLCDAHEWEGACQGEVGDPDYDFAAIKGLGQNAAVKKLRAAHNRKYGASKAWSYGPQFAKGVCAQNSSKDTECNGGNWQKCGSNTYPAGSFPKCQSKLGVFDLNGNAAEHMNLPLASDQFAGAKSQYGVTEMKGSWFIWDKFQAHQDWCRWRAPFWHGTKVMSDHSHHNYHLGFRCCKSL